MNKNNQAPGLNMLDQLQGAQYFTGTNLMTKNIF
uniref:Uncharacterized protein n=1 Tax=Arundo donax TaxID=35708 RepID=A0A0A9AZM6_ARUDO